MTLAKLIRGKSESAEVATATPATFATLGQERGRTVATVATVAVAKSANEKAMAAKVSLGDTARGWLVRYQDGSVIPVFIHLADGTHPTRAEVLRDYPGAIDAEAIPEAV